MKGKIFHLSAGLHQTEVAAFSCLMAELYSLKELDVC
jgi:hypothetical protein